MRAVRPLSVLKFTNSKTKMKPNYRLAPTGGIAFAPPYDNIFSISTNA